MTTALTDEPALPERPSWLPSPREQERAAYRRGRTRRSVLISTASTLIVLAAVIIGVRSSPGWPTVRDSFFSWSQAKASFPDVLRGFWLNIRLMVVCEIIILAIGLLVAFLRTLRGPVFFPLRLVATIFVDLFRGLPLLLVLLLIGFGVPGLRLTGIPTNPLILGGTALVLTYSAYVAEVFRAGIESVHPSQRMAARSLGLSYGQSMRFVVLPQAVRRVLPPLLNDLVSLQKDTGLIAILGTVFDAIREAQIQTATTFNYTSYVVAGVLFVALTVPMTRFTDWVARRQGFQGAGGPV